MALLNGDIVQAKFVGSSFGQQILMVRNFVITGDFPVANTIIQDLSLINTAIATGGVNDIETAYLACLSPTYSLNQIQTQRIWPVRSAYVPIVIVGGTPGTNAGATTKPNVTAGILMRTMLAGRSQRGVVHIGPSPDAAAVAGLITAAYQATLQVLAGKLLNSFTPPTSGSIVSPVAYHLKTHTYDLYNTSQAELTSRVQRRRTVGVGK